MAKFQEVGTDNLSSFFSELLEEDFQMVLAPEKKFLLNNFLEDMRQQDMLIRRNMISTYSSINKVKEDLEEFDGEALPVHVENISENYNQLVIHLQNERAKMSRTIKELLQGENFDDEEDDQNDDEDSRDA